MRDGRADHTPARSSAPLNEGPPEEDPKIPWPGGPRVKLMDGGPPFINGFPNPWSIPQPPQTGAQPAQRPSQSAQRPSEKPAGRHCWVVDPADPKAVQPGLLVDWRREQDGWWGRVILAVSTPAGHTNITDSWLPAARLRPSRRDN